MIELCTFQLPPAQGFSEVCQISLHAPSSKKELTKILNKQQKELLIIQGSELNREILEAKNVDILLSPEFGRTKDFLHHRNSGLNHILCLIARKNNVTIAFDMGLLARTKGIARAQLLGQMQQNVMLCRKYNVRMLVSAFAGSFLEQRSVFELQQCAILLGMTPGEAKTAVSAAEQILKDKKELVKKGLRVIG